MKEITVNKIEAATRNGQISAGQPFWSALLFPFWAGSALTFFIGLGISLLSALGLISTSRFRAYSAIALIFASFTLMFLAAHGMDRRDAAEKAERLERCRQRGYTDQE